MRDKNRSVVIHEALNLLDEELIVDVDHLRSRQVITKKVYHWRRWVGMAAGICLLAIASQMWQGGSGGSSLNGSSNPSGNMGMAGNDSTQNREPNGNAGGNGSVRYQTGEDVFGNLLHLKENYVSVSVLSHEAWEEGTTEPVAIGSEHQKNIEQLIVSMYDGTCVDMETIGTPNQEKTVHLFFTMQDATVIHCRLYADGIICYEGLSKVGVKLDTDIYEEVLKFSGIAQ